MRNFTIKNKIIAMIFGITVLALTLGFSIIVVIHINTMKEEMINNTSLHAKQVGDQSISPITFNDKEGIKEILSKLNTIPYIEFAQIVDAKSKILGSYSKDNEIVQITNAPKVSVHEFKNNHLYVSEPIVFENQFLGTVFLRAGTVLMYNKIKDFTISSIILCLFLVVLSYFLAFWFQNIISKPILKLAKLTHQI